MLVVLRYVYWYTTQCTTVSRSQQNAAGDTLIDGKLPHFRYKIVHCKLMQFEQAFETGLTGWMAAKWDSFGFSDIANFLIRLDKNMSCYSDLMPYYNSDHVHYYSSMALLYTFVSSISQIVMLCCHSVLC